MHSGIHDRIDKEYRGCALGLDTVGLSGRLEKHFYQDTIESMDTILRKLINDMAYYDNSLAKEMNNIQEALHSVKGKVCEWRENIT